jgi:hypothetical protein
MLRNGNPKKNRPNPARASSNKQGQEAVMGNREAVLCTLGVAVGSHSAFSDSASLVGETNFSAYADYAPVTVRSSQTPKAQDARVDRDQSRN